MAAGEAGLKWCWYPSLWQISFPAVRMTKPLHRWQVTAGLPSGIFDSPAETSGALFLCLYLALVTGVSRLSPQSVSQGGSCHGETRSDTSQMIPLAVSSAFLGLPWHCHLCIYQQGREIVSQSKPRPCSGHLLTSPSRGRCVSFLLVPPVPAELLLPMKFPDWARAWWVFYLPIATWDLVLIFLQHSFPSIFTERRMDQKWQLSLCGCWY